MRKNIVHLVNAALLLLLFGGSAAVLDRLPGEIPIHFGLSGQPDAYSRAVTTHWFLLPGISLATVALLYGCAWWTGARLEQNTVPNQARYDALPAASKRRVAALGQQALYWIATSMIVLFAALQVGTYEVATARSEALPSYVMAVVILTIAVSLLSGPVLIWLSQRRIEQLSEKAERRAQTDDG